MYCSASLFMCVCVCVCVQCVYSIHSKGMNEVNDHDISNFGISSTRSASVSYDSYSIQNCTGACMLPLLLSLLLYDATNKHRILCASYIHSICPTFVAIHVENVQIETKTTIHVFYGSIISHVVRTEIIKHFSRHGNVLHTLQWKNSRQKQRIEKIPTRCIHCFGNFFSIYVSFRTIHWYSMYKFPVICATKNHISTFTSLYYITNKLVQLMVLN